MMKRNQLCGWGSAAAAALLAPLVLLASGAAAAAAGLRVDDRPALDEVRLPVAEYLALVEKGEALDRQRAAELARRELPVAVVEVQSTAVTVGEEEVTLAAHYEALVQGHPREAFVLPFAGLAAGAQVRPLAGAPPGASVTASVTASGKTGGLRLVTQGAGRFAVDVQGRALPEDRGGVRRLTLAPVVAAVSEITVDLPADLAWHAPGSVMVDERVTGDPQSGRRLVRLAARRGEAQVIDIQRRFAGAEAEKLLAQSVVLTLFQLRPEGLRRHDVVLYEVSRGSLASLSVDLPPGLAVEQVGTDEGDVVPVVETRRLTVHRRQQLSGTGYLVLTSTPAWTAEPSLAGAMALPLLAVQPAIEVRGRFLALASSVAAEARPRPAASWNRVDLTDLPAALSQTLRALDLTAAWRLADPAASPSGSGLDLQIVSLPPATRLPTLVRDRETTTLLTVDGTLLHRDRFTLDQAGAALDVTLPAGAVLWSVKVGEQPVRPVERGGTLSIPLSFATGRGAALAPVVEVVSVLERRVPKGRSDLEISLPQVTAPVVGHRWRLLLPQGASYRVKAGDLRPVHEPKVVAVSRPAPPPAPASRRPPLWAPGEKPGALKETEDVITVTAESPLLDERKISTGAHVGSVPAARDPFEVLKNGLVGGVRPLPVEIPESGKTLLLSGALPPVRVSVALEVKGKT